MLGSHSPMRSTLSPLACLALATAAAAQAPQWLSITPTTTPASRRNAGMDWDQAGNRLIMFGGVTQTPSAVLAETWSYNGQWTQLTTATSNPRWGHKLVRNTANNRLLMFGGRSPTISGLASDTVEWTGSAWQTVPTTGAPSPRFLYGMAFDQARGVYVLFGGRGFSATFGDTWEYTPTTNTWTPRTLVSSPTPREEMAMVYDASLQRVILFGGYDRDTDTIYGDTWTFDGSNWVDITPVDPASSPSARYRTQTVYDSARLRTVMYGGFDGTAIQQQTFEFTGNVWSQVTTTTAVAPPNATEAVHGFDPVRRRTALFGGFGTTGFSSATYEFDGANTGFFSTFGAGCQTALGEPTLTSNIPQINTAWTVTYGNLPADTELVMAIYGFSNTTWSGVPLPLDLGAIGLAGCNLLVSADAQVAQLTVPGANPGDPASASSTINVPSQTALIGVTLYVQGVLIDVTPLGDIVLPATTPGGRAVLGG